MNSKLIKFIYGNISDIPTNDSPYITVKTFEAYKNSLYILAEKLILYYSQKDKKTIEWIYYWLKNELADNDRFITILTVAYIPMCLGIGAAEKSHPWILLIILTVLMIMFLFAQLFRKQFYQFHFDIVKVEFEKRHKRSINE